MRIVTGFLVAPEGSPKTSQLKMSDLRTVPVNTLLAKASGVILSMVTSSIEILNQIFNEIIKIEEFYN